MLVKKEMNSVIYEKEGTSGMLIHNQNNCEYVKLLLKPNSRIEKHALPFPVTFYIIKGNPTAAIDDRIYETSEGDLLEADKNILRGWQNNSNEAVEILVVKHI